MKFLLHHFPVNQAIGILSNQVAPLSLSPSLLGWCCRYRLSFHFPCSSDVLDVSLPTWPAHAQKFGVAGASCVACSRCFRPLVPLPFSTEVVSIYVRPSVVRSRSLHVAWSHFCIQHRFLQLFYTSRLSFFLCLSLLARHGFVFCLTLSSTFP